MKIVLTGSIAYDYLMHFPGQFEENILPELLDRISLSFLVDSMARKRGGIAANIAYTLALLGEKPKILAAAGMDFQEYRDWLDSHGVDTSAIHIFEDTYTSSFFATTDDSNAQIASFYPGAMDQSTQLSLHDLDEKPDLVFISPSDPAAMNKFIDECLELNIPYFYDPSQQIVRFSSEELKHGILNCAALFSNDYEFGLISEKTALAREDLLKSAQFVVTTRGEDGVDITTIQETIHVPSVPPDINFDPTGIGDAFRAGFLKGYLNQLSLERCAQIGALAATYCLEADSPQGHKFDIPSFISRFRKYYDDHGELDSWQ
ncbi:MAG: carbohydrate kinase family protein [Anaerolineales bacterium]|nr:carbohydrate kinase family protein [Anaerolineales bacterium]